MEMYGELMPDETMQAARVRPTAGNWIQDDEGSHGGITCGKRRAFHQ